MRITTFFGILLTSLIFAIAAIIYWPSIIERFNPKESGFSEEQKDLKNAEALINLGRAEDAWQIIEKYRGLMAIISNPTSEQWLNLFIKASELSLNIPELQAAYESNPTLFSKYEKASLLIADAYITSGKLQEYQTVRDIWKGMENHQKEWLTLDADSLLLQGKKKDAIELLKSQTFNNDADTERLIRLAILTLNEDPKISWEYLSEAHAKSPENRFVRTYRAHVLEMTDKHPLAEQEHLAALEKNPQDSFLRDQLAEFYLRYNQTEKAVDVWKEGLTSDAKDSVKVKALFWSRVLHPMQIDLKMPESQNGTLSTFIHYLQALPEDQFWNATAFEAIHNKTTILETEQVTFWLRLLSALKQNHEEEALELLRTNRFSVTSWNPDLELALNRILTFRKTKSLLLHPEPTAQPIKKKERIQSQFFAKLESLATEEKLRQTSNKIPESIRTLMLSKEAFTAAFLEAGWPEAALSLHRMPLIPENFPDWFALELTAALQVNRNNKEALQFASLQEPSPSLSVLIGEMFLAEGNSEAGVKELIKFASESSDNGYRASLLLSTHYIDQKNYLLAKAFIEKQPLLAQNTQGKELLARIALMEGNKELANRLYSSIENDSNEAKSYLARKAFADKDWKRAQQLTEELLQVYPSNELLRNNLAKIIAEQQKTYQKIVK